APGATPGPAAGTAPPALGAADAVLDRRARTGSASTPTSEALGAAREAAPARGTTAGTAALAPAPVARGAAQDVLGPHGTTASPATASAATANPAPTPGAAGGSAVVPGTSADGGTSTGVTGTGVTGAGSAAAGSVVVVAGDTLWDLAARALGPEAGPADVAAIWPLWYAANEDVVGTDPDLLLPGQTLRVPDATGTTATPTSPTTTDARTTTSAADDSADDPERSGR
uniref:LysM peptidoglycan-binding domain-containing protein n=1 Tax=Cellulomonas endophytica TaxID=2494735 RepID=UPI0013E912E7